MNLRELHCALYLLFWMAAMVAAGALAGAALFLVAGPILSTGRTPGQLVHAGGRAGGCFLAIWAPGTAVVLCVMRAYRRRHPESASSSSRSAGLPPWADAVAAENCGREFVRVGPGAGQGCGRPSFQESGAPGS